MSYKKLKIACVILASGNSERFSDSKSKLFYKVYDTPIVEITLKNITKYITENNIYITIPKKITKNERKLLTNYTKNKLILGGKTRFKSLKNALESIDSRKYDILMVHDAARPLVPKNLMLKLLNSMNNKKYHGTVPASVVEDTIRKNNITLKRNNYMTYQTPQLFKFDFFKNKINKIKFKPTDDLGVIEKIKNIKINYIESSKQNIKITKKDDVNILYNIINFNIKYLNGFDIHRLRKGKYLSLAGLKIKSKYESIGHSDGDVVLHSIIDALLSSKNKGDIGTNFPALNKYKNISSTILLDETIKKIKMENSLITNIDCTVICQKVRLENYKKKIAKNISSLLNCQLSKISVKAKTADYVGTIGKSKAIACWTTIKLINL